jgi:hypothetical protein
MRRSSIALIALFLVGLGAASPRAETAPADARWSQAGRRRILMLTDKLEKHPLASDAKEISTEVMAWWVDVPGLTLHLCAGVFLDGKNEKTKPIVVVQAMFGAGALLLQAGDKPPSQTDAAVSGVHSALEAYKNAVKADASYRDALFDQLAADPKRQKSYLDDKLKGCRAADQKAAGK